MSENKLSIDAIKEAIAADKDLESGLVSLALQTETGKGVLNNHIENQKGAIHSEATRTAYENVEKPLIELGFDKPTGVKASDWVVSIVSELKDKAKSNKATKEDKAEAEAMIKAIQDKFTQEVTLLKEENQQLKTSQEQSVVKNALGGVSLEYDANIPKQAIEAYKGQIEAKLVANAKTKDGKVVFYKEDGTPYLNDLLAPATAAEIMKIELAPILAKKTAGGNAGDKVVTEIKGGAIVLDTNSFNTRVGFLAAFNKACTSQGILKGTEDYYKQFDLTKEKYNFNDLVES